MIFESIKKLTFFISTVILVSCGSSKDAPEPEPSVAELVSPNQNSVCTTGIILSDKESKVTFTWNPSANTDSYEINIKNLLTTITTTQVVNVNQISLTLLRNTPYSWHIISKSNQSLGAAKSDIWKFYIAGLATVTHSPFPADIVAPGFGQNLVLTANKINLTWLGSDVDGDIAGYDVYFGTTITPTLLKKNITDMFLNDVAVSSDSTYYWKVITKDSQGNSSNSLLYEFKVK